jgi:hypothetical protein
MNNKLIKDISRITDPTPERLMQKRTAWAKVQQQRTSYCDNLKKQGYEGKAYSDAVVKYDKGIPDKLWE